MWRLILARALLLEKLPRRNPFFHFELDVNLCLRGVKHVGENFTSHVESHSKNWHEEYDHPIDRTCPEHMRRNSYKVEKLTRASSLADNLPEKFDDLQVSFTILP